MQANTVFAPLSGAKFLLHVADFYRELGHRLYGSAVLSRSPPLMFGVRKATEAINRRCGGMQSAERPKGEIPSTRDAEEWTRRRPRSARLEEAYCGLFALFAAGPAYARANLHLVAKSPP